MIPPILRWLGIGAIVTGYAVVANHTNQSPHNAALGAMVALAPIALAALLLIWRSRQRMRMITLVIFTSIVLWLGWPLLIRHYDWIYWLEHESLQSVLFLTFARTLIANRKPLCTRFAEMTHGPLTPAHAHYAYKVTVAWTLFFAGMIMTSTWLFFMYPIGVWSIFSNFIFLPLVALMFIAEFIIRKLVLQEKAQGNIMDAVRAYLESSRHRP
ncbi:hypothetical protein CAP31_04800 [Sulfuriferula sp. AH1]|uniref:COG4648 family protein n=1 Tax=Sulfuriferula sp. AH1 TaxID=1985873 RepID=UPI000B3B459A|nr:hypothetical protein [Sulfuriferula sp. AH1]ARU31065.1 hypothetical protein CAP31_04800 [Sulfuriferula sp. AH1]